MTDLKPTFEHYFPEGSIGGQCAAFAEKLVAFGPVGDSLASKLAYMQAHGSSNLSDIQVGDVVFTDDSKVNGHIFVVNADLGNCWRATESNYNLDQKIHHTRLVPKNFIGLKGHVRAPLKVQIINPVPMVNLKISIVDNIHWPDIQQQAQQFADLAKKWSNGVLTIEFNILASNFANFPLQVAASAGGVDFKVPESTWRRNNLCPLAPAADAIIFATNPIGNAGEQGYMIDPDISGEPFILFIDALNTPVFQQTYGYTEFTKLCLHELSHMMFRMSGQPDQTHFYDFTAGHTLAEAYPTIDYGALAANLELRRKQKLTTPMDSNTIVVFRDKADPKQTIWLLENAEWSGFSDFTTYQGYLHGRPSVLLDLDHDQFVKLVANPEVYKS